MEGYVFTKTITAVSLVGILELILMPSYERRNRLVLNFASTLASLTIIISILRLPILASWQFPENNVIFYSIHFD